MNLEEIKNLSSLSIFRNMVDLSLQEQQDLLNSNEVKRLIQKKLFDESQYDTWAYFREVFSYVSVETVLSFFDEKFLKHFMRNSPKAYVLFAASCEKNVNETIKCVMKSESLFHSFCGRINDFYSAFYDITSDNLYDFIKMIRENNSNCPNLFIGSIKKEVQEELLNKKLDDDTLVWFILGCSPSVKQNFFLTDSRAKALINRFNVASLANNGIQFAQEIVDSQEFFDQLTKDLNIVDLRTNINTIENKNASLKLKKHLKEYYERLLASYNSETKLFKEYETWINGSQLAQLEYLQNDTAQKISEIVVDAIFEDNIYNVWANIKELVRYDAQLDQEEKITQENKDFYELILNIDGMSNEEKINIYNKYKDQNINVVFYDDVRRLKDIAYTKMNKDIIKLEDHPQYLDIKMSQKAGVSIYDLREKQYYSLVRTLRSPFDERTHIQRSSYSLISNLNNVVFDNDAFIYGYDNFDNQNVLHVFEGDSFSADFFEKINDAGSSNINRIMNAEEIANGNYSYSEIQIVNPKLDDRFYQALKPSYLVVKDQIDSRHIDEAKRLNIPIVLIKSVTLLQSVENAKSPWATTQEKYVWNYTTECEEKRKR